MRNYDDLEALEDFGGQEPLGGLSFVPTPLMPALAPAAPLAAPVAAAPAPAPAGQWVRQPSGGEGWEDVFVPAPAPAPAPRPALSLPSGWETSYVDMYRTPGDEEIKTYETKPYAFGVRDEDILRSLGFQGEVIKGITEGHGEYLNTYQELTPEAQEFLKQGGYQLASKRGQGGDWFAAVDPTGKFVGTPVFRKDENDPLLNAVFAALSVAAGNVMGPGMSLVNAARAFDSGDTLGGLASLAGGVGGLGGTVGADVANAAKTVGQGLNVARAIEQGDPLGLLASGAALTNTTDIGGMPVKDILNYGKVAQAIANEDVVGALGALGNVGGLKVPEAIADPLNIVSGLYQASQGSGKGLVDAIRGIGKESAIGLSLEEADRQDALDELVASLAPTSTPLPQTPDLTDYGAPAPTASAPTATDTYMEDFESAIPEAPDEEPIPELALSRPVVTPESVLTPEVVQELLPASEPVVEPPAYIPPEQEYTQDQAIEELLRQYAEPEQYQPEMPEPTAPESVEVTGAREQPDYGFVPYTPFTSPVSVEDILNTSIEQGPLPTLEQLLGPEPQIAPAAPERVEVTGSSLSSPVSVEDILSAGIEQPRFTTVEQLLPPAAQQVVTTGSRATEEPPLPETLADTPRTFNAKEGELQTVEITGSRPGLSTAPELATPILDPDLILKEGIDLPKLTNVDALLGPSVAPAPRAAPQIPTYPTRTSVAYFEPQNRPYWLKSDPTFLKTADAQEVMQLAALQQILGNLSPELASIMQDQGFAVAPEMYSVEREPVKRTYFNEKDLPEEQGYASGGSASSSWTDPFSDLQRAFAPVGQTMLQGSGTRKKPMALSPLRQIVDQPEQGMARGGLPAKYREAAPPGHNPEFITGLTGFYADGRGTGQSDDIPAMLHDGDYVMDADTVAALGDGSSKAGRQALEQFRTQIPHHHSTGGSAVPAKIADGEYVLPESFVTALGDGDNRKGSQMLDQLRKRLRMHKRSAPASKIPPKAKSPLDYLRGMKG